MRVVGSDVTKCPLCGGQRRLLYVRKHPQATEWYCEHCHKSWLVDESDLPQLAQMGLLNL